MCGVIRVGLATDLARFWKNGRSERAQCRQQIYFAYSLFSVVYMWRYLKVPERPRLVIRRLSVGQIFNVSTRRSRFHFLFVFACDLYIYSRSRSPGRPSWNNLCTAFCTGASMGMSFWCLSPVSVIFLLCLLSCIAKRTLFALGRSNMLARAFVHTMISEISNFRI